MNWRFTLAVPLGGLLLANTNIPPNFNTGRPGEITCANCHMGASAPADSAQLCGLPAAYQPDSVYRLTLAVRCRGMKSWGFEVTCADSANQPAGRFLLSDSVHTQLGFSRGFEYVKQNGPGAYKGRADSCSWSFDWRAPDSAAGPITFYWDALACNNDNSAFGDVEVLGRATVGQRAASPPVPGRHLWHYARPESTRAIIVYRGAAGEPFRIYSADGRLVGECRGAMTELDAIADWPGIDSSGATVPAGDYFIELGEAVDTVIDVQFVNRLTEGKR
jgi:hypothetical protein